MGRTGCNRSPGQRGGGRGAVATTTCPGPTDRRGGKEIKDDRAGGAGGPGRTPAEATRPTGPARPPEPSEPPGSRVRPPTATRRTGAPAAVAAGPGRGAGEQGGETIGEANPPRSGATAGRGRGGEGEHTPARKPDPHPPRDGGAQHATSQETPTAAPPVCPDRPEQTSGNDQPQAPEPPPAHPTAGHTPPSRSQRPNPPNRRAPRIAS